MTTQEEMANNRLYIIDTDTGDAFMLCKSFGAGWGSSDPEMVGRLNLWLGDRDENAHSGGKYTKLTLVTENGSNIDSVAVCKEMEKNQEFNA